MPTTSATRVREMVSVMYRDADDGVGTMLLVETGQTATAISAFPEGKGHVPILIRAALLQRLLMTVARLHDQGRDTEGLPAVFRLLRNPDTRSKLLPFPDAAVPLDRAIRQWRDLRRDPRFKRIWAFRTNILAHSISAKPQFDRPVFGDLMTGARDTFAVVEALAVATGVASVTLKPTAEIWRQRAEDYWRRLAGAAVGGPTIRR